MNEDTQILLICYVINWITLCILILLSKMKRKTLFVHLSIQAIYTTLFFFDYTKLGQGGSVLAIWFIWILIITLQWISYLVHMIVVFFSKNKKSKLDD